MRPFRLLSLVCLASSCAVAAPADAPARRLPRSTPEAEGISSKAILEYVNAADATVHSMNSFMLLRHGKVVAEGWWTPYAAEEPHSLFSLSKSFTSTAVGLAVAEGRMSVNDPVLGFFPGEGPKDPSPNQQAMRIRDLLRMSSGQHGEDVDPFPFNSPGDLVRLFLNKPVAHKPGTHFFYNTAGTYVVAAAVQKATGQTVRDYLEPRLFEPLGMGQPKWETSEQGIPLGGFGLNLRTEDIASFGQLLLQRGQWNGRQLVPAAWIDEATSLQTSNGSNPASDWEQGYGYQFWRCTHGAYRGDGAFGQLCVVIPGSDVVVAATAATGDIANELGLVWKYLLPAFKEGPLPADPAGDAALSARLAGLSLPTQKGDAGSPTAASVAGRRYAFEKNPLLLESVTLEPGAGSTALVFRINGADTRVASGFGAWNKGSMPTYATSLGFGDYTPVAVSGAWTAPDTYTAQVVHYRTPFVNTFRFTFSGDRVTVEDTANLGLWGSDSSVHLVGTAPGR